MKWCWYGDNTTEILLRELQELKRLETKKFIKNCIVKSYDESSSSSWEKNFERDFGVIEPPYIFPKVVSMHTESYPWQIGFQDSTTPIAAHIIEIHNFFFFSIIVLSFVTGWLYTKIYIKDEISPFFPEN